MLSLEYLKAQFLVHSYLLYIYHELADLPLLNSTKLTLYGDDILLSQESTSIPRTKFLA